MDDTESKMEISKEVLAPADGIRDDLVATAVKFLQNPRVQQSTLSQRTAFLQRKGLTAEEIEIALQRAGIQQSTIGTTIQGTSGNQSTVALQHGTPPNVQLRAEVVSKWIKTRNVLAVVTVVSGISYAAYKLYTEFLGPWLFGIQTADKRLEKLEKIVAESVANVNTTLTSIDDTLNKQQEKLHMLSHDVNSKLGGESVSTLQSSTSITEIKSELSSIKGLLLNRRQFPAMPSTTPVLPSWQLVNESGDANSNKKGQKDSNDTTTPKITYSYDPAPERLVNLNLEETNESGATHKEDNEVSMSEYDSRKNAKNSNSELDGLENEASKVQNEADSEKNERPEMKVTEVKEDSEGNN